jgi:hypothetical protein
MKMQIEKKILLIFNKINISSFFLKAMDYFSTSMITHQSENSSTEPLLGENELTYVDTPSTDNNNRRRSSRSSLRNSDTWARKRALMQRGYEWTITLDREQAIKTNNPITEYTTSSNIKSLPNSITNSSTHTNQSDNNNSSKSDLSNYIANNLLHRRRSSRRLPAIPADSLIRIDRSNNNVTQDDQGKTSSRSSIEYQPLRENSLTNRSNRSKSIDSESSLKTRSSHTKLSQTHMTQNAKSIDVSHLTREKAFLGVNNTLISQRSIDYPCIVRKAQDLSDIVRRRMLYTKLKTQQQGENYNISLERDHVPKVPRKIIIRQDNSIEIALR